MHIDSIDLGLLAAALANERVGHTVDYYGSVPSTMPLARALAVDPATRPGVIVVAEEQTAGRGRLSRGWQAPYGDALLLTVVLKPPLLPLEPAQLPMIAGISMVETIGQLLPSPQDRLALKWPNDVLLGLRTNAEKDLPMGKVAGILIEAAYIGPTLDYALLGMGINVNQDAATLRSIPAAATPAISLRQRAGHLIDRTQLCIALCLCLGRWLFTAQTCTGSDTVHQRWRALLATLGSAVTVHGCGDPRSLHGRAVDVDRTGNLIVEDDGGVRHTCSAGDVTLRPMN